MASIVWNITSRNVHADEQMRKEIRQKLAGLEKHLEVFPPNRLHLQVLLEKHPKKPPHTIELTLRLPANILHSKRSAPDLMTAFDDALQVLLGELESGKGGGQRGAPRKRNQGGEQAQAPESAGFAAEAQSQGAGPQNLQDVIREFLQQNYHQLLYHARRQERGQASTSILDVTGQCTAHWAASRHAKAGAHSVTRRDVSPHEPRKSPAEYLLG